MCDFVKHPPKFMLDDDPLYFCKGGMVEFTYKFTEDEIRHLKTAADKLISGHAWKHKNPFCKKPDTAPRGEVTLPIALDKDLALVFLLIDNNYALMSAKRIPQDWIPSASTSRKKKFDWSLYQD